MIEKTLERLEEEARYSQENAEKSTDISAINFCKGSYGAYIKAIEIMKEESKNGGWIPVSERVPEDGQRIIATFTDGSVYQVDFKLFLHENPQYAHNHNVIAWQPLPAPYRKGE